MKWLAVRRVVAWLVQLTKLGVKLLVRFFVVLLNFGVTFRVAFDSAGIFSELSVELFVRCLVVLLHFVLFRHNVHLPVLIDTFILFRGSCPRNVVCDEQGDLILKFRSVNRRLKSMLQNALQIASSSTEDGRNRYVSIALPNVLSICSVHLPLPCLMT